MMSSHSSIDEKSVECYARKFFRLPYSWGLLKSYFGVRRLAFALSWEIDEIDSAKRKKAAPEEPARP